MFDRRTCNTHLAILLLAAAASSGCFVPSDSDTSSLSTDAAPPAEDRVISVVRAGSSAILGDQSCSATDQPCAGRIEHLVDGQRADLCVVELAAPMQRVPVELCLTGLRPAGAGGLVDHFRGLGPPPDNDDTDDAFWGASADIEPEMVVDYRGTVTPRFAGCRYLYLSDTVILCAENGNAEGHVWSVSTLPYCDCDDPGLDVANPESERQSFDVCAAPAVIEVRAPR